MTTNTASADHRLGLISAPGDSAASALELMSPDRSGQKMRFLGDIVDPSGEDAFEVVGGHWGKGEGINLNSTARGG